MTPESVIAVLDEVGEQPTEVQSFGLIAPLMRASGHLLFALAGMKNETEAAQMTAEEVSREISDAATHLNIQRTEPSILSTTSQRHLTDIASACTYAAENNPEWTTEQREQVLTVIVNNVAGFGS